MKSMISALAVSAALAAPASAAVVIYDVGSQAANINTPGFVTSLNLQAGQSFWVNVIDPQDTWSLGAPPREFTADGFEETVGGAYGTHSAFGQSFRFGSLVGRIGSDPFFYIGLGGVFTATTAGTLSLFNWDSNYSDNSGSIQVSAAVPLPATGMLLLGALGLAGVAARRRNAA